MQPPKALLYTGLRGLCWIHSDILKKDVVQCRLPVGDNNGFQQKEFGCQHRSWDSKPSRDSGITYRYVARYGKADRGDSVLIVHEEPQYPLRHPSPMRNCLQPALHSAN